MFRLEIVKLNGETFNTAYYELEYAIGAFYFVNEYDHENLKEVKLYKNCELLKQFIHKSQDSKYYCSSTH